MVEEMEERGLGGEEIEFLRTSYREYYYRAASSMWIPRRLEAREVGFLTFDGGHRRHLRFSSPGELIAEILREIPWGVFYSVSLYEDPGNPEMERKGWVGADLVFDIDVKDLHPACIEEHDFYLCNDGSVHRLAERPMGCRRVDWVCPMCVEAGRKEVLKLLDVLQRDMGIRPDAISVYFSGHRGFHVHVEDENLMDMGREARAQIVDYLMLNSYNIELLEGFLRTTEDGLETLAGWPWRIAEVLRQRYGVPPTLRALEALTKGEVETAISSAVRDVAVHVDPQVTMDLSRIFRMPTSLNEKTGMMKQRCADVVACDPLKDAVAIGDYPVKVEISYAPKLQIGGYTYGPYKRTALKLPAFVAAFLVSKGVAKVIK
ncbi:MAG TPA: hypothetical protein ENO38_04855 [Nitrososphaeria archaeon]|nr:DNA primase small subunit domain-containing protein [Conexivisphaerales archaeon]PMP97252.1 MAG: hypothetical protein C0167_01505 [Nitrososphaera sp.]HEU16980.1 hypothetical protein [Nitrososphaeria archaeon]